MIRPKNKHHTKRHSGWYWVNLWKYCPICDLGVRCCIVEWLGKDWYRCPHCLLKLPISDKNQRAINFVWKKQKQKSAIVTGQTSLEGSLITFCS